MRSSPEPASASRPAPRDPRLRVALLIASAGLLLSFLQVRMTTPADPRLHAMRVIIDPQLSSLGDPRPSIEAAWRLWENPRASIYTPDRTVGSAFIYPPLAALVYTPLAMLTVPEAHVWLALADHVLYGLIIALLLVFVGGGALPGWRGATAVGVAAVLYHPLIRALELNQATLLVTAFLGIAFVALQGGRQALAGVALALAASIKPQLVLILPLMAWSARRMVAWTLGTGAVLLGISLLYAGLDNHLQYLTEVLPALSPGYAFYPNQSWTGLVNRLDAARSITRFAIVAPSLEARVASAALAASSWAAALWVAWRCRRMPDSALMTFGLAWLAATVASPVAWEHHYAPGLFVFAAAWRAARPQAGQAGEPGTEPPPAPSPLSTTTLALLVPAFVLMASYFEVRRLEGPLPRLLVSYGLFGALLLGVGYGRLLLDIARSSTGPAREETPAPIAARGVTEHLPTSAR